MLAGLITPGSVQAVATGLLVTGVLLLVFAHRAGRFAGLRAGIGALFATLGVPAAYRGLFLNSSDGPTGWTSLRDIFSSLFDSWLYVFVVALIAAALWIGVDRLGSHRWSIRSALAVSAGSLVASLMLGLLDGSI